MPLVHNVQTEESAWKTTEAKRGRRGSAKRACLSIIIVGLAICAGAASRAPESILVHNPGFENDWDGDGVPDNWTFTWLPTRGDEGKPPASRVESGYRWDREKAHAGRASLRCGVLGMNDNGYWEQQGIPVSSNIPVVRVAAWCRAKDVRSSGLSVGLIFRDAEGKPLGEARRVFTVGSTQRPK